MKEAFVKIFFLTILFFYKNLFEKRIFGKLDRLKVVKMKDIGWGGE